MKYMNARSSQRFLAYLVDVTLISMVVNIIVSWIPAYSHNINIVAEYYQAMLEGNIINEDISELTQIFQCIFKALGILMLVEVPIYVLYMVVLPYFWEKQTIGRLIMHLKVVSKTEEKAKISNLLLRELIGGFLLLRLLSVSVFIPIIYWYLSTTTGRTLADMIGGTRLVDTRFINAEFIPKEESDLHENKDYIDATFKDVSYEDDYSFKEEEPTFKNPDDKEDSSQEEETEYRVF